MTDNGAYAYGVFLGAYKRAAEDFLMAVSRGFKRGYARRSRRPPTPEEVERARERLYEQRIAQERTLGRLYVQVRAREIRNQLGLPRE